MGEGIASGSSVTPSSARSDTSTLPCPLCLALLFIMWTQVLNSVSQLCCHSTNISSSWSRWNTGAVSSGYFPASPPFIFRAKPRHWHLISGVEVHSRSPSPVPGLVREGICQLGFSPPPIPTLCSASARARVHPLLTGLIDSPGRNKISQSSLNYPPVFRPPS